MSEKLAMIEEVGVGARDVGRPVMWFTVTGDGWGALQVFNLTDPTALILLSEVREVHDLNGRMCVVSKADNTVTFKRLLPPPRTNS